MCKNDYPYIIRALEELAGDPVTQGIVQNYPTIEQTTMAAAAEAIRVLVEENNRLRGEPHEEN